MKIALNKSKEGREAMELNKTRGKEKRTAAADSYNVMGKLYTGLSLEGRKMLSGRMRAVASEGCQCCIMRPSSGVLVAREIDQQNARGAFTVLGLCDGCYASEIGEIESCLLEKGFRQPVIYWFERKQVH
jgi:hypothetical protein